MTTSASASTRNRRNITGQQPSTSSQHNASNKSKKKDNAKKSETAIVETENPLIDREEEAHSEPIPSIMDDGNLIDDMAPLVDVSMFRLPNGGTTSHSHGLSISSNVSNMNNNPVSGIVFDELDLPNHFDLDTGADYGYEFLGNNNDD
jgi:hypothetical protein